MSSSAVESKATSVVNTGSSEYQIRSLTKRIQTISDHMKKNKKDLHCRLGLMKAISARRSLLDYYKRRNEQGYLTLIAELGLRR